jgi:thymidylate synthase ThyX
MPKIFIYDEFNPEDNAMLQALYSRSPLSVEEHANKVRATGSGAFMEQFYVGYGHASIADCASTTIFTEQLSTLADKAIQDWPLYAGQETSTRYVDMSKQPIIDPLSTKTSTEILSAWMDFYVSGMLSVTEHIKSLYPKKNDEDETVYGKAVKARAFDIMRGFLPAGITTQLSWHTNLRQAHDKLSWLKHHPLDEVKQIAQIMHKQLKEKYPHSFSHISTAEQEDYREKTAQKYNYYQGKIIKDGFKMKTTIKTKELDKYSDIINNRPEKTSLPHFLGKLGQITFDFMIDFGSWRDIQRHRNGICLNPLLTAKFGFHPWYLEQLPEGLKIKASELIASQSQKIKRLKTAPEKKQYYTALGFNLPCSVTYTLPAAVYVLELRSGKYVHPSLRQIAHKMHSSLQTAFPNLQLLSDLDKDDWDVRRGLQDITDKHPQMPLAGNNL